MAPLPEPPPADEPGGPLGPATVVVAGPDATRLLPARLLESAAGSLQVVFDHDVTLTAGTPVAVIPHDQPAAVSLGMPAAGEVDGTVRLAVVRPRT